MSPAPASIGRSSIDIVMPAYNEAPDLAEIVPETVDACRESFAAVEVLVVDDGSTDDTREVGRPLRLPRSSRRGIGDDPSR